MNSALHEEYEEGFDTLGDVGTVFYKFFSLFTVKISNDEIAVRFGRKIVDPTVSGDVAQKLKEYTKEQKEWIREQGKRVSPKEARRRLWWIVEKIIEYGVFTIGEQKHMMIWLDICLDRTMEV